MSSSQYSALRATSSHPAQDEPRPAGTRRINGASTMAAGTARRDQRAMRNTRLVVHLGRATLHHMTSPIANCTHAGASQLIFICIHSELASTYAGSGTP